MRVLQLTNYYYPNYGGIEQVAHDIAQALALKKYEQKVICINTDADAGGFVCHKGQNQVDMVDGVEVIRCACTAKLFSQSISFSYGSILRKVMDDFHPDYVILHYPNPFTSFFLSKYRNRNFKLLLYWHSDIVKQKYLGKLFLGLEDALAEWATRIVATSPNYIEGSRVLSKYRDKCVVIPNCVNEDRLKINNAVLEKSAAIRKSNDDKTVCFAIGRHVPYKGFEYLIKASKLLDENYSFFIAGDGPLTESLKEMAKDDERIHFIGRLSDDDLLAYYHTCDIFCFPSITKNEAFGVVLLEAMYYGKPVVTFSIPGSGVNYVSIKNETGLECPNKDVSAYAKALQTLAYDKELRTSMGLKAQCRVKDIFMFDQFKEKIYEVCS